MQQELLGLIAETQIHAGTGRATGFIDLPIMREAHTGWPCVFGSAVKGALRCAAEQMPAARSWLADVFGPDTKNASDHAGALAVSDARLLLLPVRSLTSHYKWVTCPALLKRAADDARRAGKRVPDFALPKLEADEAITSAQDGPLYLEEFHFRAHKADLTVLIGWLSGFVREDGIQEKLAQQLAIVNDDLFAHIAQFATPVTPHIAQFATPVTPHIAIDNATKTHPGPSASAYAVIAIDNATKTVKNGQLWYEETLPPDTVLYLSLAASGSRRKDAVIAAGKIMEHTLSLFPAEKPYLQLGGNETTGMGWCRVSRVEA